MQKYTVKLLLWKRGRNKAGYFPIYIKVIIDRKTSYLSTGWYIPAEAWDEKRERMKSGFHDADIYDREQHRLCHQQHFGAITA